VNEFSPCGNFLCLSTFEPWTNFASHRTTIWGVDVGIDDAFVAADGIGEERIDIASCHLRNIIIYAASTKRQKNGDSGN
jgi:hypothetical protein